MYPYTQWLMIIIPTKWLFHWGYTMVYPIFRHTHMYNIVSNRFRATGSPNPTVLAGHPGQVPAAQGSQEIVLWEPLPNDLRATRPGKQPHNYGKSPFLIGKPSISMGHLYHSYVSLPEAIRKLALKSRFENQIHGIWRSNSNWMNFIEPFGVEDPLIL